MTYREVLDRYIKNDECADFLSSLYGDALDNEIERDVNEDKALLYYLFRGVLQLNDYTPSGDKYNIYLADYIQCMMRSIGVFRTIYIYEWKSIPEWLDSIKNEILREHLLHVYEMTVKRTKNYSQKTFKDFKTHDISSAMSYLVAGATVRGGAESIWLMKNFDKSDAGDSARYFNNLISPGLKFIIHNNRDMNDFDAE